MKHTQAFRVHSITQSLDYADFFRVTLAFVEDWKKLAGMSRIQSPTSDAPVLVVRNDSVAKYQPGAKVTVTWEVTGE